jgi:hypothetical protein
MFGTPTDGPLFLDLEWEFLHHAFTAVPDRSGDGWPLGTQRITVSRDDSYRLHTVIEGAITSNERPSSGQQNHPLMSISTPGPPGTWIVPFSARGQSMPYLYTFHDCVVAGQQSSQHSRENPELELFQGEVAVHEVERVMDYGDGNPRELSWFTEWFLNGPDEHFFYTRRTKRRLAGTYERERLDVDVPVINVPSQGMEAPGWLDHVLVDGETASFVVTAVPRDVGPGWSRNVGIEYHVAWGVPDQNTREAIAEIVSFVMGRQLLFVGSSSYDQTALPLTCTARSPWGDNATALCASSEHSPVQCAELRANEPTVVPEGCESTLQQLVPGYLEKRLLHRFKDAMWRYWLSFLVPFEAQIPAIATAVEILADGWYRSTGSPSQGTYMEPTEFQDLVGPELQQLASKLSPQVYGDRMLRRITHAYEVGANQRVPFFLEELKLPIGQLEKRALRERNAAVHGGSYSSEEGYKALARQIWVYQTLFHRIVLKLLHFQGKYVDRATEGWPERSLDEPIGGAQSV